MIFAKRLLRLTSRSRTDTVSMQINEVPTAAETCVLHGRSAQLSAPSASLVRYLDLANNQLLYFYFASVQNPILAAINEPPRFGSMFNEKARARVYRLILGISVLEILATSWLVSNYRTAPDEKRPHLVVESLALFMSVACFLWTWVLFKFHARPYSYHPLTRCKAHFISLTVFASLWLPMTMAIATTIHSSCYTSTSDLKGEWYCPFLLLSALLSCMSAWSLCLCTGGLALRIWRIAGNEVAGLSLNVAVRDDKLSETMR
ncbi:hypothetical protein C8J56DRAFT_422056 [Mycena floridula]|nr:hypothetical protein C8J56DRAFT_422056 [Mycena floridula]